MFSPPPSFINNKIYLCISKIGSVAQTTQSTENVTQLKKNKTNYATHSLPLHASKSDTPGILNCFTYEGIAASKEKGFLYNWRVIVDDIDDQLYILGVPDIPAQSYETMHIMSGLTT